MPVFRTDPAIDNDPAVMRARLARLGGRSAPNRPFAIVSLGKEPRALPDATAKLDELLKLLSDVDPEFGKLDVAKQHERAQTLRDALAKLLPQVAASRAGASKGPVLLLSAHAGRNQVEQAISALRASDAAFAKQPWDKQTRAAGELLRFFNGRVI